jgi:hypothetical protein
MGWLTKFAIECEQEDGRWLAEVIELFAHSRALAGLMSSSFHDREELGPRMLARIAKVTGLRPDDL